MNVPDQKHILIVDDSLDMQVLLKMLLESKGFTADCTSNGEEALDFLNSSDSMPAVILLDLRMPKMGGIDFIRIHQQLPKLKDIPIILMTADEDVPSQAKSGYAEVLTKPFNIKSLLEAVERTGYLH